MQKFSSIFQVAVVLLLFRTTTTIAQSTTENFTPYGVDTVQLLQSEASLGGFNYTILNEGKPSERSSLLCQFDGDGSILIGFKNKVTEIRIASKDKKQINMQGFRASLINSYNNQPVSYSVSGYREGKLVTLNETVEINTVKLPGIFVNLESLPGFNMIDELRISGSDVKLTLEEFIYQQGESKTGVTASN